MRPASHGAYHARCRHKRTEALSGGGCKARKRLRDFQSQGWLLGSWETLPVRATARRISAVSMSGRAQRSTKGKEKVRRIAVMCHKKMCRTSSTRVDDEMCLLLQRTVSGAFFWLERVFLAQYFLGHGASAPAFPAERARPLRRSGQYVEEDDGEDNHATGDGSDGEEVPVKRRKASTSKAKGKQKARIQERPAARRGSQSPALSRSSRSRCTKHLAR